MESEKAMKRIHVSIMAGASAEALTLTPEAVDFKFIFGVATEGITPFENALHEMKMGEEKELQLAGKEVQSFFGQMFGSVRELLGLLLVPEKLVLRCKLVACEDASPTEVVQYMAKVMSHGGCGCGTDCGCG